MNKLLKRKVVELVVVHNHKRIPLSSKEREKLEKIYPYYGAQGIVDYVDRYLFDGEFILIAEDGENLRSNNQSICNLANGKFWVNNHAHIITSNEDNITRYLYYNFNQLKFEPYVTGSAQPKLNKENLLSVETFVHTKHEQKLIANLLSSLDDKIELNNRINEELEAMSKLIYDYWFVQFDFPNEKGKPYKSSGGRMVWNKELKREIPEGWEVKNIEEIAKIVDCLHSKKPEYCDGERNYYLLQLENILDNGLVDIDYKYFVRESDYKEWTSRIEIKENDILITNAGRVAATAQASKEVIAGIGRNITAIRPLKISPTYFFLSFRGFDIQKQIKANTDQGAFFTSFNVKGIKKLNFIIPPKNIELAFENLSYNLRRKRELNVHQNQHLASLRDWLLPMLMNGQVSVVEAEEEIAMVAEGKTKYKKK